MLPGEANARRIPHDIDPWRLWLGRLHGKIGDNGIERITTQTVFDIMETPQRNRSASACRRLAKSMSELGWTAVRVRGLTRGGIWNKFGAMPAMLETSTDPARLIDARGS